MTIVHLIDDGSPGGVTRFLKHLTAAPGLPAQEVRVLYRGRWSAPAVEADLIVSHLVVSWKNLPLLMALRARYPATPLVHVEHSYSACFVNLHVRRKGRFATLLRVAYALFDRVVAVSEAQAAWLGQEGLVREGALTTIPPAVDLAPFLALPQAAGPVRRIAALGRLDAQKGFDVLIQAFRAAALEDAELHIHGEGPELARLMALAGGDPRIVFHGFSDPVEALACADAVAMPSARETYGLVALEARAAGRLLLVSGEDGLSDHARDGAVAVGRTVEAWIAALRRLPLLQQAARTSVARHRAAGTARNCIADWRALVAELRPPSQLSEAS